MWDLVRKDVGQKLLGRSVSTVPVLDRSNYFDILAVYRKLKTPFSLRTLCAPPRYQVLGRLEDMLVISVCDPFRIQKIGPHDMTTKIEQYFEYTVRDMVDVEVKEIVVKIDSTKHQKSDLETIESREIFINRDHPVLQEQDTLYIISDVYICNHVYLLFRLGDKEMVRNIRDNRIPIAFCSHKFRVKKDGSLVFVKKVKPMLSSKDAVWYKPNGVPFIQASHPSIMQLSNPESVTTLFYEDEDEDGKQQHVQIIMEPQMPQGLGEEEHGACCPMRIPPLRLQHALPSSEFLSTEPSIDVGGEEVAGGNGGDAIVDGERELPEEMAEGEQSVAKVVVDRDGTFVIVPTPIRKTQSDVDRLYRTDTSEPPAPTPGASSGGSHRVSKIIVDDEGKFHVVEEIEGTRVVETVLPLAEAESARHTDTSSSIQDSLPSVDL